MLNIYALFPTLDSSHVQPQLWSMGQLYRCCWDLSSQLKGNLVAFVQGGQSFTYFLKQLSSPAETQPQKCILNGFLFVQAVRSQS